MNRTKFANWLSSSRTAGYEPDTVLDRDGTYIRHLKREPGYLFRMHVIISRFSENKCRLVVHYMKSLIVRLVVCH